MSSIQCGDCAKSESERTAKQATCLLVHVVNVRRWVNGGKGREGGRQRQTEGVRKVLVSRNRSLLAIQWRSVGSQIGFKSTIYPKLGYTCMVEVLFGSD